MNKKLIFFTIPLVVLLVFLGCSANLSFGDPEQVAEELKDMGVLLNDITAALTVIEEPEADSRTVQPGGVGNDTPEEIYNAGTPVSGVVTYPESGFLRDLYGNDGDDWYFTLEPNGADHYDVELFIYPRPNFYITYAYEYYITEDGTWNFLSDTSGTVGFLDLKNYYTDGTTGTRTLVDISTFYSQISVPDSPLDNLSSYTFTSISTAPAPTTGTSDYSAESTENIPGSSFEIDSKTYYTEHDSQTLRTSVAYIEKDYTSIRFNDVQTVTRSEIDAATDTSKIRSLTTDNTRYTMVESIDTWVTDNIKHYSSSKQYWYTGGPSSATGDPLYTDSMSLTETGEDTGVYSGTRTISYGGREYSYSTTVGETSRYSMKFSRTSWSSRQTFQTIESVEIDLQSLDELSFQMPGATGIFTGYYEQGVFEGTYSIGNRTAEVTVNEGGILVDDTFFSFGDL